MKTTFYKRIYILIALTLASSLGAPSTASATDSDVISNVVMSSSNSGGQSTRGADGQNGQDGADGQSGKDGKDGANGQTGADGADVITSHGTSTIRIKSTINGVDVVDIDNSRPLSNNPDPLFEPKVTPSTETEPDSNEGPSSTPNTTVAEDKQSFISKTLLSISLMLINYVNKLF